MASTSTWWLDHARPLHERPGIYRLAWGTDHATPGGAERCCREMLAKVVAALENRE